MNRYELCVFIPLHFAPEIGHHVVHVFHLDTESTLPEVKAHADELACQIMPGTRYDALNVREVAA